MSDKSKKKSKEFKENTAKFSARGKTVSDAISIVRKIAGTSEFIYFEATKDDGLVIAAQTDLNRIRLRVPNVAVTTEGVFGVQAAMMVSICSSREDMDFNCTDNTLQFQEKKGSKYCGNISITPYTRIKLKIPNEGTDINPVIKQHLFAAISNVNLKPTIAEQNMVVMVRFKNNELLVSTADSYHAALSIDKLKESKKKIPAFEMQMPLVHAQTIATVIDAASDKYRFAIDANCIYVETATVKLSLPMLATNTEHTNLDAVLGLQNNFGKADLAVKIKSDDFQRSLENTYAVSDGQSYIQLTCDKKGLKLLCKSSYGTVSDTIQFEDKGSIKGKINLDPTTIMDIMQHLKKDIYLHAYQGRACRFTTHHGKSNQTLYYSVAFKAS